MTLKKARIKRMFLRVSSLALILLALTVGGLRAQTREQVRSEAETALQKMTPAEIDAKLKEMGMTREEAAARAKEYGISLDDYLSRMKQVQPAESSDGFSNRSQQSAGGDPRFDARKPGYRFTGDLDTLAAAKKKLKKSLVPVPGFTARYGLDSLIQPYGHDIFDYQASFFTPSASSAPPPSYVLGPGDELSVSMWGETRFNLQSSVNREGNIVIADVGPVGASGLTVQQFQEKLLKRMSSVYSSLQGGARARTFLDVSLGKLKNIQVFVVGEVNRPGGYSIPSMSTVMTAIYSAEGPGIDGSLRNIQIIRKGERLPPVDLYMYIAQLDKSADVLLADGDIVNVVPASRRVAITGDVIRSAIYEIREGEGLGDLIRFAGGLRFYAYAKRLSIDRIVPFRERKLYDKDRLNLDVNFQSADELLASKKALEDGDVVHVFGVSFMPVNQVEITGPVYKPGRFELTAGLRVAELITRADSMSRSTFGERGTIYRMREDLRREIHPFNVRKALAGDPEENLLLQNEDSVVVYPEGVFLVRHAVAIRGAVKLPGDYPRSENMSVGDLIVMAGGITEKGTLQEVEVSRMDTVEVGRYSTIFRLDLPVEYWGTQRDTFRLRDYDLVSIPENPKFELPKSVQLTGYVMSPGTYAIRSSNERLADIFKRAGGLRLGAYLEGSRLFRRNMGMVPLNFKQALEDPSSRDNVVMYDGDSVHVALVSDVVVVSGEVFVPSPVLYKKGASLNYYVDQAGGPKSEADEDRTVVMLPGGKKWEGGGLFGGDDILPGSTVFVPKKIEKEDKTLPMLRDIATILASLAALTIAMVQVTK
jgi:polysaccharide export outer membrane protein